MAGKDGSLIRPRQQQSCCCLIYKVTGFKAALPRYSLTQVHNPRRNLYAPIKKIPLLHFAGSNIYYTIKFYGNPPEILIAGWESVELQYMLDRRARKSE